MRGGEKVLEALCELFPDSEIFTLVHIKGSVSEIIENRPIHTSFIQHLPLVKKKYRTYLPLFPTAVEQLDLRPFDLVLSSSHCVAKGAMPRPGVKHICYCHTPMRYVWDLYGEYFGKERLHGISRWIVPLIASYLRTWDAASAPRVDLFVANSAHVKERIRRYYARDAEVVHPPVDTGRTFLSTRDDGYFLVVSAFAPYKRVDMAIEAFNRTGEKLVIVGSGQEEKRLKKIARPNIEFAGWVDSDHLGEYYAGCRALIFPGEEDFGIVPVEAQCYGKPVIAFGRGGVLETVRGLWADASVSGKAGKHTGLFFRSQTPGHIMDSVRTFSGMSFDPSRIREHALQFDRKKFKLKMSRLIAERG